MILAALQHLTTHVNQSLKRAYGISEDVVVLCSPTDSDGNVAPQSLNKLALFLVNIEKDSMPRPISSQGSGGSRASVALEPMYLNLYVLLAANFNSGNYAESLKYLSSAISYFHQHPTFDHHTTPDLHGGIDKLIMDVENLKIQELSNLWGILGGKYSPSMLYKVRMVAMGGGQIVSRPYSVRIPEGWVYY